MLTTVNSHPFARDARALSLGARRWLAPAAIAVCASAASAADLTYLRGLLDATPQGGWVQANVQPYSSGWATGPSALPDATFTNPGSIVRAWSSFAWDSKRGNLLLWGGGHANFIGNEMYIWQGVDGTWTRGSVSSRIEAIPNSPDVRTRLVVDDAAPQSSHTYDNQVYLPVNDMFLTLGGAAYDDGDNFQVRDASGTIVRAGPWMWDPTKADPDKVGGTTGSGYDPLAVGGQMWLNRMEKTTGVPGRAYINGTTGYRQEGGKDVVYATVRAESSGFPALYRYVVGDVRNGGLDAWERVGESFFAPSSQGAGAVDTKNGLYVHTSAGYADTADLGVWVLAKNNTATPAANLDKAIELKRADGSSFDTNIDMGMAFDEASGRFLLWDGRQRGTVWSTEPVFEANGDVAAVWTVTELPASTPTSQPSGNFVTGVLGKWQYISELRAFIALNEFDAATGDAQVWLYKPYAAGAAQPEPAASAPGSASSAPEAAASAPAPAASAPNTVPTPGSLSMVLLGLIVMMIRRMRRATS